MNSSFSRQVMPKVDVVLVAKCPGRVSPIRTSSQNTPPKTNGWNLKKAHWKRKNIYKHTNHQLLGSVSVSFWGCKQKQQNITQIKLNLAPFRCKCPGCYSLQKSLAFSGAIGCGGFTIKG